MNIEESIDNVRFIIGDLKASNYNQTFITAIETLLTAYEKEKEKNKELVEQNKDVESLFNIQASIAKELDFNTNDDLEEEIDRLKDLLKED